MSNEGSAGSGSREGGAARRHPPAFHARERFAGAYGDLETQIREAMGALRRSVDDAADELDRATREAWRRYDEQEMSERAARAGSPRGGAGPSSGERAKREPARGEGAAGADDPSSEADAYYRYLDTITAARRAATRTVEDARAEYQVACDAARQAADAAIRAAYATYLQRLAEAWRDDAAVALDPMTLGTVGRSIASAAELTQRGLDTASRT